MYGSFSTCLDPFWAWKSGYDPFGIILDPLDPDRTLGIQQDSAAIAVCHPPYHHMDLSREDMVIVGASFLLLSVDRLPSDCADVAESVVLHIIA